MTGDYLSSILERRRQISAASSRKCAVSKLGYLFSNFELGGKNVVLTCKAHQPGATIEELPDKMFLAFAYYALHRHHLDDPNKSNYYLAAFDNEWQIVRGSSRGSYVTSIGTDI